MRLAVLQREDVDEQRALAEGLRLGRRQLLEAEGALAHQDAVLHHVAAPPDRLPRLDRLLRHHRLQLRHLRSVAVAVTKANILDNISGSINFMAITAEEYIELEFRKTLKDNGQIKYLTGKGEFIRLGLFDNVDIAFMTHSTSDNNYGKLLIPSGNNGLIAFPSFLTALSACIADCSFTAIVSFMFLQYL